MTGTIVATVQEWAGVQILIRPDDQPAFAVVLFHVAPAVTVDEGTRVQAGQRLGTHVGDQTWSDVAIRVDTPQGFRLVSWFDAISDDLFDTYRRSGVTGRDAATITRAQRDADPLTCAAGAFVSRGSLPGWVLLR